jgi:hypothetical protein
MVSIVNMPAAGTVDLSCRTDEPGIEADDTKILAVAVS